MVKPTTQCSPNGVPIGAPQSLLKNNMDIELVGWISEEMSDEEVIAYIDELEAEEEARIELADMAREGWR